MTNAGSKSRWLIAGLLFLAMTLNYFDRQMVAVLKPMLSRELHWSEAGYADIVSAFQAAYAASYFIFGRLVDRLGAKFGFVLAFAIWSIAQIAHGFSRSLGDFMAARVLLGVGEGGAYPAGLAAIAHWFPKSERAFATGIANAGVNIGAILTPLFVPALVLRFGWRSAFIATGLASLVWVFGWVFVYRSPKAAQVEAKPKRIDWSLILSRKEAWAYAIAKFLIDPIWWMFLFWLPDFFAKRYGLDLKSFGPPLVAIYVFSDFGNLAGGWFSSHLIKRGLSTNDGRKTTMLVCALLATPVAFVTQAQSLWLAVGILGLATAAHQAFSVNLFTFPSDVFPQNAVGSVIGFGGMLGAIGGIAIAQLAGFVLGTFGTFAPLFALAGIAYLIALLVLHLISPRMEGVKLA